MPCEMMRTSFTAQKQVAIDLSWARSVAQLAVRCLFLLRKSFSLRQADRVILVVAAVRSGRLVPLAALEVVDVPEVTRKAFINPPNGGC